MPDRFKDYGYSPFPYEDKLQELMGQQPQWQPRSPEQLTGQAQQYAGLQIDPQIQALQRWEPQQARRDVESAVSRGGARGGGLDWLAAQRQERFGGELQRLEGVRGDVTAQHLAQLEQQEHSRGMEGYQYQMAALQQLAQRAQAHDMEQWQRALGVHDRTMLTPMQQHQLNLGYGELIGQLPDFMVDPYGARQGATPAPVAPAPVTPAPVAPKPTTAAPAAAPAAPTAGVPYVPSYPTQTYKITSQDTLGKLAQKFGTTVDELMKLNQGNTAVRSRNLILTGYNIKVPVKEGVTTTGTTQGYGGGSGGQVMML